MALFQNGSQRHASKRSRVWDFKRDSSDGMQRLAPYSGRYQAHEFLGEAKCPRNLGPVATAYLAVATQRIKYHGDSWRSARLSGRLDSSETSSTQLRSPPASFSPPARRVM